ncbi:MAG TPA: DUF4012 domain-containing protein [Microbacterium sp.]|nr:DUF4012 domain-containing protein [Microbacterium sp.]
MADEESPDLPVPPDGEPEALSRAERRAAIARAMATSQSDDQRRDAAPDPSLDVLFTPEPDAPKKTKRRRRGTGWIIAACIVIPILAIAAFGVLLGLRALEVKDELTAAQQLVPAAAAAAKSLDVDKATADFDKISVHTEKAVELTSDPLWGIAEKLPWVGTSARAVTEITAVTDDAIAAVRPMLAIAPNLLPENLVPVDGAFPVATLTEAAPIVQTLATDITRLQSRLAKVDVEGTPDMLVDGKAKLTAALTEAGTALETADTLLAVAPDLLGANGERRYLLVFQNNAEALNLGGSAASQTLVGATDGKLAVLDQAGSGDFDNGKAVDVPIPAAQRALYGNRYGSWVNLLSSVPDWPTAAQQAKAFWQRDINAGAVDGVASIDPLALQRILGATGPITVDGRKISADNAVKVLLHDVYTWWPPSIMGKESDDFFANVAEAVFNKVASGQFDFTKMMSAIEQSIDAGSIMYWTDNEAVADIFAGLPITGAMPTDNADSTTVGVFFRDTSASKIDYYVDTTAGASAVCSDGAMTLTTSASVTYSATPDELRGLPKYIIGSWNGTKIRTQVFIYAPPGMTVDSINVDGREVRPFRQGQTDLGRVVAPFEMYLRPGETAAVTATFTGTGDFGPLAVRTTPMIRPTTVTVDDQCG